MNILMIDSDEITVDVTIALLEIWGYNCTNFRRLDDGLKAFNKGNYDLLWIDYKYYMPKKLSFRDLVNELKNPVIITSTIYEADFRNNYITELPYAFFHKPYLWRELLDFLKWVEEKNNDLNENLKRIKEFYS